MSIIQSELTEAFIPPAIGLEQRQVPKMPFVPKTLSAHFVFGVSEVGTEIFQNSIGPCGRAFGYIVVGTGYAAGTLFALAEAIALLSAGAMLDSLHYATGQRFRLIDQLSVGAYSMSLHSAALVATQIVLTCKRAFSEYHAFNLLLFHGLHRLSFPTLSLFGKVNIEYILSATKSLIQDGPLLEVLHALRKDFRPDVSELEFKARLNECSLEAFLSAHPQHVVFIQSTNIVEMIFGEDQRDKWQTVVSDFVRFQFDPLPEPEREGEPNDEQIYQERLCAHIKSAFKEVYNSETLAGYIEGGKEALEGYWEGIFIPLARYAVLKELEEAKIICPYTEAMIDRYSLVEDCQKRLRLRNDHRDIVKALLTGESTDPLVRDIGVLAADIHQGALLTKKTSNFFTGKDSYTKLFYKSLQEALSEVTAAN